MTKVLWFSNTPANADEYFNNEIKQTGGWLKSLDLLMQDHIDLHIAFKTHLSINPFEYKKTTYYPITIKKSLSKKILNFFNLQKYNYLDQYQKLIMEINPDVIHIHGTESDFGLIYKYTDKPIVVSIQGNLTVYTHKFFSGLSKNKINKYFIRKSFPFIDNFMFTFRNMKNESKIESEILKNSKYIIGRTDWDKNITKVLSPQNTYFHNDEVLRDGFYKNVWDLDWDKNQKIIIHTTTGDSPYKGFETILQAANLLLKLNIDFEWRLAGLNEKSLITKVVKSNVGNYIKLLGNLNENELIQNLKSSHIYVMPSHIENSPNSLCEAMILGVPCISAHVGGTGSILKNKKEGVLIQDGDPWMLAGTILEFVQNFEQAKVYGKQARKTALIRHNKEKISNDLKLIYNKIVNE